MFGSNRDNGRQGPTRSGNICGFASSGSVGGFGFGGNRPRNGRVPGSVDLAPRLAPHRQGGFGGGSLGIGSDSQPLVTAIKISPKDVRDGSVKEISVASSSICGECKNNFERIVRCKANGTHHPTEKTQARVGGGFGAGPQNRTLYNDDCPNCKLGELHFDVPPNVYGGHQDCSKLQNCCGGHGFVPNPGLNTSYLINYQPRYRGFYRRESLATHPPLAKLRRIIMESLSVPAQYSYLQESREEILISMLLTPPGNLIGQTFSEFADGSDYESIQVPGGNQQHHHSNSPETFRLRSDYHISTGGYLHRKHSTGPVRFSFKNGWHSVDLTEEEAENQKKADRMKEFDESQRRKLGESAEDDREESEDFSWRKEDPREKDDYDANGGLMTFDQYLQFKYSKTNRSGPLSGGVDDSQTLDDKKRHLNWRPPPPVDFATIQTKFPSSPEVTFTRYNTAAHEYIRIPGRKQYHRRVAGAGGGNPFGGGFGGGGGNVTTYEEPGMRDDVLQYKVSFFQYKFSLKEKMTGIMRKKRSFEHPNVPGLLLPAFHTAPGEQLQHESFYWLRGCGLMNATTGRREDILVELVEEESELQLPDQQSGSPGGLSSSTSSEEDYDSENNDEELCSHRHRDRKQNKKGHRAPPSLATVVGQEEIQHLITQLEACEELGGTTSATEKPSPDSILLVRRRVPRAGTSLLAHRPERQQHGGNSTWAS